MKVSIITATYNSERHIQDAIKSCINQTYPDIEHIVIDGNSKDNTLQKVNEFRDHISVLISEPDTGIYNALNKGIRAATGDIVGFLHSDDILFANDVIEKIVHLLRSREVDSVYGNGVLVSADDETKIIRQWVSGPFDAKQMFRGWMPMHPTFFVKRRIYEEYGLFDESYRISADYDRVLAFLHLAKISTAYLPENIVRMRVGGASTSLKNMMKKWKEDVRVMKKHNINPYVALPCKNLSKIRQFFVK